MHERSFTDYVTNRFYDGLFDSVKAFVEETDVSLLNLHSRSLQNINEVELIDIEVKSTSVGDLPEMSIAFDVIVDAEFLVKEVTRHYDKEDECHQWFNLKCKGDLDKNLDDFEILDIEVYERKSSYKQPLANDLVPIMPNENLDEVATEFLQRYYPEVLIAPMPIDPRTLAERMGLTIQEQEITAEGTTFGQIYFCDTDTVKARTILVDPQLYFLKNLGSVNNTIVHECVHWAKHRKPFELQRLYDSSIEKISCQVAGGIKERNAESVKWMEWQANTLTPRIMMPAKMFMLKTMEVIQCRINGGESFFDALEPAIDELAGFFSVSRLAAKIRMIDVGYYEAIGAFNYIDGRYVKPYAFDKGTLARNQTFSISYIDAAILPLVDAEYAKIIANGKYVYVDAHVVLNSPRYLERDKNGNTALTLYARQHMNECCLAFDITIKSKDYEQHYSTECVLNRDERSPFEFEIKFHHGYQNSVPQKQAEYLEKVLAENLAMYSKLSNDPCDCLEQVREWRDMTYIAIADEIPMEERQVRRIFQEGAGSLQALVSICLVLHLPPEISFHIIDKSQRTFSVHNRDHQWYQFILRYSYGKSMEEVRAFLQTRHVSL